MLMIRSGTIEPPERTIARFVSGLKYEIAYIVELQQYDTLEQAMQLALKVERQRHSNSYRTTANRLVYDPSGGYSKSTISDVKAASYKVEVDSKKEEGIEKQVEKPSNNRDKAIVTAEFNQDFGSSSKKKNREVKCFKC